MPTLRGLTCLAAAFAALPLALSANAVAPIQLQWERLPFSVVGKTVLIVMPEGPVITGKATAVTPDALLVNIKSTTDAKAYPKGPVRVPRAALRDFRMRTKGKAFRIVGTVLGGGAGLFGGALAVLRNRHHGRSEGFLLGIWAVGTAGGYLLGNAADKRWAPVHVVN